jgi:flagellar hook-associated protein 3 FlgL
VYRDVRAGNGTFTTAAAAGNAGSGVLDTGSVTDRTQWIADTYTLAFATPTTWQVTDSGGNTVASGSYVDGGTIAFRGVQVSVSGTPATGDAFTVAPAATQDVFTTLDQLASALAGGASNDASRARLTTSLNASLQQIDQAMANFSTVRATVGARLSLLSDAETARQGRSADLTTAMSNLQDLDYASAVSRMNQQYVSLQAAQQSYASISKLSLFSFL